VMRPRQAKSLPRPLLCTACATAHARKRASTHSSVGRLRIPSPTRHCVLLLHTHARPPLQPSSPHHRPAATHHRSSHQGSQRKCSSSPLLPLPTSSSESQRAGRILGFPRPRWLGHFCQRAKPVSCGLGPNSGPRLCGSLLFHFCLSN
jgi:hypothetical protein